MTCGLANTLQPHYYYLSCGYLPSVVGPEGYQPAAAWGQGCCCRNDTACSKLARRSQQHPCAAWPSCCRQLVPLQQCLLPLHLTIALFRYDSCTYAQPHAHLKYEQQCFTWSTCSWMVVTHALMNRVCSPGPLLQALAITLVSNLS